MWQRQRSERLDRTTQRAALRKLLILDAADQIGDLRIPPGNRLEKLEGDRGTTRHRVEQPPDPVPHPRVTRANIGHRHMSRDILDGDVVRVRAFAPAIIARP